VSEEVVALCVLLWAREGRAAELASYEDDVLELLAEVGAAVVARLQGAHAHEGPDEVQVIAFPTADAFDSFMSHPSRLAMGVRRDEVVERTEVLRFDRLG
jgi:uncharacterized protein (DUF1330 family)